MKGLRVLCLCMCEFDHPPTKDELRAPGKHKFLGFSATEDRLAKFVPETIELILRAGIKIFMLTGDNPQTAKNIAAKCQLISLNDDYCVLEPKDGQAQGPVNYGELNPMSDGEYAILSPSVFILRYYLYFTIF